MDDQEEKRNMPGIRHPSSNYYRIIVLSFVFPKIDQSCMYKNKLKITQAILVIYGGGGLAVTSIFPVLLFSTMLALTCRQC